MIIKGLGVWIQGDLDECSMVLFHAGVQQFVLWVVKGR